MRRGLTGLSAITELRVHGAMEKDLKRAISVYTGQDMDARIVAADRHNKKTGKGIECPSQDKDNATVESAVGQAV